MDTRRQVEYVFQFLIIVTIPCLYQILFLLICYILYISVCILYCNVFSVIITTVSDDELDVVPFHVLFQYLFYLLFTGI